jgi:hypothetical protein
LISLELGADGLRTDWINPSVFAGDPSAMLGISARGSDAAKTPQQGSFDFAQDFACGSRSAKRLAHTRKRLNFTKNRH